MYRQTVCNDEIEDPRDSVIKFVYLPKERHFIGASLFLSRRYNKVIIIPSNGLELTDYRTRYSFKITSRILIATFTRKFHL